jgi:uncharacterized protein DUF6398
MRAAELCAGFGVSQSTGFAKAKVVRDALGMGQMDTQWYRPSKMEDNPLAWMIMVDGFVVDVRRMSRAVQAIAYEKGLIPYIPGEQWGRDRRDPAWVSSHSGQASAAVPCFAVAFLIWSYMVHAACWSTTRYPSRSSNVLPCTSQ